ncbi:hypothetical protein ACIQ1D_18900 [Lysinibacillus xylanilyticus]|uniref:hypothetical protein n=1 Tax=Lysinibacillus xylanilyticus TaxID=582475 RepID=UPI0038062FAD
MRKSQLISDFLNNKISITDIVDELYDAKKKNEELTKQNIVLKDINNHLKSNSIFSSANEKYRLYNGIQQTYLLIENDRVEEIATINSEVIPSKGELVSLSIDGENTFYKVKYITNIINVDSSVENCTSSVGVYVSEMK